MDKKAAGLAGLGIVFFLAIFAAAGAAARLPGASDEQAPPVTLKADSIAPRTGGSSS